MTKNPQLRGQKLLDAIEICLRQLAGEKDGYVYNASELARRVGCSRPTLDSKAEFIDGVLIKIGAEKRLKREHPLIEHLHTRIERLEDEKQMLKRELDALREHHAQIYSTLYRQSVDAAVLIKPIVEAESIGKEKCILCGQALIDGHQFPVKNSVIDLTDRKNRGG